MHSQRSGYIARMLAFIHALHRQNPQFFQRVMGQFASVSLNAT